MYKRSLNLESILKNKSILLLGARQTGKTTYLKTHFPKALYIDLLDLQYMRDLSLDPHFLEGQVAFYLKKNPSHPIVIIDEIQKMPELLDSVHRMIEAHKKVRFILTGSSARKLKRAGANLLGGRLTEIAFLPLAMSEFLSQDEDEGDDDSALFKWGGLPFVLNSTDHEQELRDYISLYLKYEIQDEGLVRNLPNFSRFLEFAGLKNGQQLNYASLSSDAQLPPRTVQDYFDILEDTLIGYRLSAFRKTIKRKAVASPKFFLFDMGVANSFHGNHHFKKGTPYYGQLLEHFVFCELKAYQSYRRKIKDIFYWRSVNQDEVDFVVQTIKGNCIGIEVKSSSKPTLKSVQGLKVLNEDIKNLKKIVVCGTIKPSIQDDIEFWPYREWAQSLWNGEWD